MLALVRLGKSAKRRTTCTRGLGCEAATCFLDAEAFTAPDKDYPDRFILIGLSRQLRVLFVVSAEAGERIRIISARKASPAQRKVYENGP